MPWKIKLTYSLYSFYYVLNFLKKHIQSLSSLLMSLYFPFPHGCCRFTNPDGRYCSFIQRSDFTAGRYKLHFDVDRYFELRKVESLYPFIEVLFIAFLESNSNKIKLNTQMRKDNRFHNFSAAEEGSLTWMQWSWVWFFAG